VATVFATDEAGLLLQEYQDLDLASSGCVGFLGVSAPHLLLLKGSAASHSSGSSADIFAGVPLRCFSGLVGADDATRRALLDFNYLLAMRKLEEAFRAVSALKSPAVWRNMAHMAIKNKQLAVAGAGCFHDCFLWQTVCVLQTMPGCHSLLQYADDSTGCALEHQPVHVYLPDAPNLLASMSC
jgi:hypothetical protein